MEDTLRYFFSSIFQGIAAILTLGAMFYMNYNDKVKSRISELIEKAKILISINTVEEANIDVEQNRIEVMRHKIINKKDNKDYYRHFRIIDEYDELNEKLLKLKSILPALVFQGFILLVFSCISLFFIGYSDAGNIICFYVGILSVILTIVFLSKLITVIKITTDIGELKLKDLFFISK